MGYPKPYEIPYDPWFDYNIPAAINDTLQCWIATEDTAKWTTEVNDSIHSKTVSYTHLTLPTIITV